MYGIPEAEFYTKNHRIEVWKDEEDNNLFVFSILEKYKDAKGQECWETVDGKVGVPLDEEELYRFCKESKELTKSELKEIREQLD